jgi:hypothetical protein
MKPTLRRPAVDLACGLLVSAICCVAACSRRTPPPRRRASEAGETGVDSRSTIQPSPSPGTEASGKSPRPGPVPPPPDVRAGDPEPDADAREDAALPVAVPDSGNPPGVVTDIRREDGEPMTEEERRKVLDAYMERLKELEKERLPLKAPRSELPGKLKERLARKIRERELVEQAYERLRSKIRNWILNQEYHLALQILEADPDFVKYRHDPLFKELHEAVKKLKARARQLEEEAAPAPAPRPAVAGDSEGREE